jgi:hypothetical protein
VERDFLLVIQFYLLGKMLMPRVSIYLLDSLLFPDLVMNQPICKGNQEINSCSCDCRDTKQQLLLGIRRANRQPTNLSSSVLSSDSMHIGVLAAAAHAAANNSQFTIFYNPR